MCREVGGEEVVKVVGHGDLAKFRSNDVLRFISDRLSSSLMSAIPDKMLSMVKTLSFLR